MARIRHRLPSALRAVGRVLAPAVLIPFLLLVVLVIPVGLLAIGVLAMVEASIFWPYAAADWFVGALAFMWTLTAVAFLSVDVFVVRWMFAHRGGNTPAGADASAGSASP